MHARPETPLYPLLFAPVYKDYLWGGRRIAETFGRGPETGVCAEAWELADRPEGTTVVRNGPLAGVPLGELVARLGTARGAEAAVFPLLIKIIDAHRRPSVQVHPDADTAARRGGEQKTEMWYVLDAAPGAVVYAGLADGVDRAAFERALAEERLETVLHAEAARPGTSIFIPGGTVHAIGEGCLLLEVQQNSNTTYRVYDWGRVGPDGKPRELHVAEAMAAIDWNARAVHAAAPRRAADGDGAGGPNTWWELVRCPYFHARRLDLAAAEELAGDGDGYRVLFAAAGGFAAEGGGRIAECPRGTTCLLPAGLSACRLTPLADAAEIVVVEPPAYIS